MVEAVGVIGSFLFSFSFLPCTSHQVGVLELCLSLRATAMIVSIYMLSFFVLRVRVRVRVSVHLRVRV